MNLTQGILTLIVLAVVVWQAPRVQWKTRQARYLILTLVSCSLAATLHIPAVESVIDQWSNLPHIARVLKYGFAVTMVLCWIAVCLCLAPASIYRRRWILLLAPFAFGMVLLIWGWEVFSGMPLKGESQNNLYGLLMTIAAQT